MLFNNCILAFELQDPMKYEIIFISKWHCTDVQLNLWATLKFQCCSACLVLIVYSYVVVQLLLLYTCAFVKIATVHFCCCAVVQLYSQAVVQLEFQGICISLKIVQELSPATQSPGARESMISRLPSSVDCRSWTPENRQIYTCSIVGQDRNQIPLLYGAPNVHASNGCLKLLSKNPNMGDHYLEEYGYQHRYQKSQQKVHKMRETKS